MLANRRHQLSVQREASTHSKIERARSLAFVIGLNGTLYNGDSTRLRDSAMLLIQSVQAELDRVLMSLFYAQRSLKTYTLQEVPIFLDVGYVHPDLDRDFVEGLISEAVIGAEYAKSWANIVRPVELQLRYDNYFSQTQLNTDFLKLSVVDRVALDRLRDEQVLELVIDPVTDMNPEHFNTKIVQVFAALVGARSRAGVASLEVEHGAIYSQYTVTETPPLHVQTLTPRTITLLASHTPLQRSELTLPLGPSDFQVSPLFGRGVGGRWSLRITDFEFTQGGLDLSALTEVQVWIAYQFVND
jgi:hypothetical protein